MNKSEQEYFVQKIRTQYIGEQHTALDELKKLDTRVKAPANAFAYIFGTCAALVMGAGMSLIMTDVGLSIGLKEARTPGFVVGIVGMLMAIVNYPVYRGILGRRRRKYASKIIALSDQVMGG